MLEMVTVMAIVVILVASLVGGFAAMQKNQRLASSTQKVLSTLYLARSLAIGSNAIYHVRIENWHTATGSSPDPYSEQYIRIYYFPKIQDALAVTREDVLVWDNTQSPVNYRVGSVQMDPLVYLGIQNTPNATAPSTDVLSFNPDGTANTPVGAGMYFFVTDVTDYRDMKDPLLGTMLPNGATYYAQLNNKRHDDFNSGGQPKLDAVGKPVLDSNNKPIRTPQPSLRMIRVLPGGSIKLLEPGSNGVRDRLP